MFHLDEQVSVMGKVMTSYKIGNLSTDVFETRTAAGS